MGQHLLTPKCDCIRHIILDSVSLQLGSRYRFSAYRPGSFANMSQGTLKRLCDKFVLCCCLKCCITNMSVTNYDLNYYYRCVADLLCSKPLPATLRFVKETVKVDRQKLFHSSKQHPLPTEQSRKPHYLLYKLCTGVGTVCGVKICSSSIVVSCQAAQTSRLAGLKSEGNVEEDAKFDWSKFFALLWPHIWYLLAAIAVCLLYIKYIYIYVILNVI